MNTQQKATLPAVKTYNGKWKDGKEQFAFAAVVAYENGKFQEPVTARWWRSRHGDGAGRIWCTVWARSRYAGFSGHGSASGCGYHKPSAALQAALQAALDSAGITLALPIDGRGEGAMSDALTAVARALGYETTTVVHG